MSLFKLLLMGNTGLLAGLIHFFISDITEFCESDLSFHIFQEIEDSQDEKQKHETGKIDENNFDIFRNEVLKCLGLKQIVTKKPKYKTERARLLAEKIEKSKAQLCNNTKPDENLVLDNMIKKYCTHNKVGINILNVWDMTFYQFNIMFTEYMNGREMDFNDAMATHTFSYKDPKDYIPGLWIEQIHHNHI